MVGVSAVFLMSTGLSAKVKKDGTGQNVDHSESHRQVRKLIETLIYLFSLQCCASCAYCILL